MTSVKYETIFSLFLGSITDYKLASLDEEDANVIMTEYLHKALAASYLSRIFSSISTDDDSQVFSYELKYTTDMDEADFVCNAIAKWMVYEWLHNQVRSVVNTSQFFGGSEQKYYSQAAHIGELRALQDDAYKEARSFVMDRGWINNSYLGGQ
jgi:hypothetical protein